MYLQCKECGSDVKWEGLKLGHLERNVYKCLNGNCINRKESYIPDDMPLPQWVQFKVPFKQVG